VDYIKQYKLMVFNYYVLFKTEKLEDDYQPIVAFNITDFSQTTHVWDKELNGIIPALWYILHLPRVGFDTLEMDIDLILSGHDEPHNIIPVPYCQGEKEKQRIINKCIINPTLIICEDGLYEDVANDETIQRSLLNIVKISELSLELLQEQWKKLQDHIIKSCKDYPANDIECYLTDSSTRGMLPLFALANQFGLIDKMKAALNKFESVNDCNNFNLGMHDRIIKLANKISNEEKEYGEVIRKFLKENNNFKGVPLVITMSGTTTKQIKMFGRINELPVCEKEIIGILGYHRAIAKNALFIDLDCASQEMFTELATLEEHCKVANKNNNVFIWKTLRRIGKLLNAKLKEFDIDIVRHVSQITVFSDFPIGLAILPECSAPLCCIKPISYRPLTPLTKAFEYEMEKSNQVYFGKQLKIVIAECVDVNDGIRHYCDGLTATLKEMVQGDSEITLIVEDISSVRQFKDFVRKHSDASILLISAHGTYQSKYNMAGLVIGNEIWMADDNDIHVPPVVLLSACHVMPRGQGAVSVGDLFIRLGAKAVLGTFIPVDVRRNATLIVRLFTDILEVRKGWSNMRTLDEIWSHVVCTNAIHEIIAPTSSNDSKLEIWANTKKKDGTFPQAEFKNKYSVGRLRSTHAYEDTENILGEIAVRDGLGEYYNSFIKSNGYFPESIFYQLIGMPENIFIRNSAMEQWHEMQ